MFIRTIATLHTPAKLLRLKMTTEKSLQTVELGTRPRGAIQHGTYEPNIVIATPEKPHKKRTSNILVNTAVHRPRLTLIVDVFLGANRETFRTSLTGTESRRSMMISTRLLEALISIVMRVQLLTGT